MRFFLYTTITLLASKTCKASFFLRQSKTSAEDLLAAVDHTELVQQEHGENEEEDTILRHLGYETMELFGLDPSLYTFTECAPKECMPVSFFVTQVQPNVLESSPECTSEDDCEGAYSCRYIDPAEEYAQDLDEKDTGFVCAQHAKVASVCDMPCVQPDAAEQ